MMNVLYVYIVFILLKKMTIFKSIMKEIDERYKLKNPLESGFLINSKLSVVTLKYQPLS